MKLKRYDDEALRSAGSFIITGFSSRRMDAPLRSLIRKIHPLGLILFYRNISSFPQVKRLCRDAEAFHSLYESYPLLLCLDQEGGYVARLREKEVLYPSPLAMSGEPKGRFLSLSGYYTGLYLLSAGISLDLAPVLDVYKDPLNPTLGPRSFGRDPRSVIRNAGLWLRGAKKAGLLTTAKHFPGKGRARTDSHFLLPLVDASRGEIERFDAVPFRSLVRAGIDAVMTSHAWYKAYEKKRTPGTLSARINHDLLREKIGFRGLLISDDMEMGAITGSFEIGRAAVRAVQSGVDALLVCKDRNNVEKVHSSLAEAISAGEISREMLQRSLERKQALWDKISCLKKKRKALPGLSRIKRESAKVLKEESRKIITLVKGRRDFPLDLKKKFAVFLPARHPRILVEDRRSEVRDLMLILRKRDLLKNADIVPYRSLREAGARARKISCEVPALFFCYDLFRDEVQSSAFSLVRERFASVVSVVTKNPLDAIFVKSSTAVLATCSMTHDVLDALMEFLVSGNGARGKIPVEKVLGLKKRPVRP